MMKTFAALTLTFLAACGGVAPAATQQAQQDPPSTTPAVVNIVMSVTDASVVAGQPMQFSATVTGSTDTDVSWQVQEGAAGGTISTNGLYTAPDTTGTYHLIATASADTTKTATAVITVTFPCSLFTYWQFQSVTGSTTVPPLPLMNLVGGTMGQTGFQLGGPMQSGHGYVTCNYSLFLSGSSISGTGLFSGAAPVTCSDGNTSNTNFTVMQSFSWALSQDSQGCMLTMTNVENTATYRPYVQ